MKLNLNFCSRHGLSSQSKLRTFSFIVFYCLINYQINENLDSRLNKTKKSENVFIPPGDWFDGAKFLTFSGSFSSFFSCSKLAFWGLWCNYCKILCFYLQSRFLPKNFLLILFFLWECNCWKIALPSTHIFMILTWSFLQIKLSSYLWFT